MQSNVDEERKKKKIDIFKNWFSGNNFSHCNLWKCHVSNQQWFNMYIRILSWKQQWKHTYMIWNPDQEIPKPLTTGS